MVVGDVDELDRDREIQRKVSDEKRKKKKNNRIELSLTHNALIDKPDGGR